MVDVRFNFKLLFFDKAAVMNQMDTRSRAALGRFGALVRKTAIASVKEAPATRHAPAGSPPFSHASAKRRELNRKRKAKGKKPVSGFKGLKHILFAYEPAKRTVIIGPASNRSRSITIPEILEEGKLDVSQHPFMGRAMSEVLMSPLWRDSIREKGT